MLEPIASLAEWLDASPTPFHVVDTAIARLESAGHREQVSFTDELHRRGYHKLDGSIVAWSLGDTGAPLRIVGAHTDSPNLRVQASPDISVAGWSQLGVEIYGGVLLNSWLDRDLGLAGRIMTQDGREVLFSTTDPVARIPQLAIHLDREIGEKGLLLDRHAHTPAVWATSSVRFADWLADTTGVSSIAAVDAQLFDVTPAGLLGVDGSLLASARLDNQLSCWAAITALATSGSNQHCLVVLNDHEEVGSASTTGAGGPLLEHLIAVLVDNEGLAPGAHLDRLRASWCLSADNAHAVHPNYPERHDPRHGPLPNHGVALKLNGNQRYATSSRGVALARSVADRAGVPLQTFMSRNNMPCGSTIGPITATRLGIEAIDVGVPQLSMHSARELCGVEDARQLPILMSSFFEA